MSWSCSRAFMLIVTLCYLVVAGTEAFAAPYKTESPIWSAKATVASAARNVFLAEVAKFADEERFAIRIAEPRSDREHFVVDMWREDVDIIILNPFDDPTQFRCAFYQAGALPVPNDVILRLADHLKRIATEVAGVLIQEKPQQSND
jgi:hypothetical protein